MVYCNSYRRGHRDKLVRNYNSNQRLTKWRIEIHINTEGNNKRQRQIDRVRKIAGLLAPAAQRGRQVCLLGIEKLLVDAIYCMMPSAQDSIGGYIRAGLGNKKLSSA